MSRVSELFLRAIARIDQLFSEIGTDAFTADNVQVDGVLFNLMVIGEAVKNIPEDVRSQYPEIRWRDIGRFCDRVVHHYFSLDMSIVLEIVTAHLPALKAAAEKMLQNLENGDDENQQPG